MSLVVDVAVRRDGFRLRAAFDAAAGRVLAILGPNGAGKSTLVDAVAGLAAVEEGRILLDGRPIHELAPEHRGVGVAFQDGLLFARMSARENVAFPLRARGAGARASRLRAEDLLARVAPGLDPASRADRLSGGERQKVALARALAAEPRALLLDEPLAAVDVGARADLRRLLRREIASFDGPCVLIAHDPVDALTLADDVVILEHGVVVQTGTPEEIRRSPRSAYAADLVGVNLFVGRLEPADPGAGTLHTDAGDLVVAWPDEVPVTPVDEVLATIRPIDVSVHLTRPEGSARNVLAGEVEEVAIHGERARVRVASTPRISAEVTRGSVERLGLRPGTPVFASWKAVEVRLMVEVLGPDTLGA